MGRAWLFLAAAAGFAVIALSARAASWALYALAAAALVIAVIVFVGRLRQRRTAADPTHRRPH